MERFIEEASTSFSSSFKSALLRESNARGENCITADKIYTVYRLRART